MKGRCICNLKYWDEIDEMSKEGTYLLYADNLSEASKIIDEYFASPDGEPDYYEVTFEFLDDSLFLIDKKTAEAIRKDLYREEVI